MKVLLITPDAQMHKLRIGSFVRSMREAPLTLITLAALTREQADVEYQVVDESIDPVPLDANVDLVGISLLTGTARRGYALADHFRARGIPVVLGGVHVTLRPDEARPFADSIVIGMAESTWPEVIRDARAHTLKPEYREPPSDDRWARGIPTPRWELLRKSGYMMPHTIMATRGCMHTCDFCTVPGVWRGLLRRPVEDVVRDVRALPGRRFALNDVSPFDDLDYAKELLTALIPLNKSWGGLATTGITRDPELFDLLVRSGCKYLLLGFESTNQDSLNRIAKGFNKEDDYAELMHQLHRAGIIVQGCFVFGFDEDGPDVFAETVERVQALKIDIPRYSFYTPYPGSRLFKRLHREQRILTYDWSEYDTMHVVFRPERMSPAELYEGFRWAYRETFSIPAIFKRTVSAGWWFPITFVGNLAYRIFVKRLDAGPGFQMPLASAPSHALGREHSA